MVDHRVTFGILLTSEFGREFYKNIVNTIENYKVDDEYPEWIAFWYSAQDDQLVLGFYVNLTKHMDIKAIEKKWDDMYVNIPEKIRDIIDQYDCPEPNFHVLSGKY